MSLDLLNAKNEHFRCSHGFLHAALVVAQEFGWVRAGTVDPLQGRDDGTWAGAYDVNNGQVVRDEDAHQLGAALERALDKLRDGEDQGWLFRGDYRDHLTALAHFCQRGTFRIY